MPVRLAAVALVAFALLGASCSAGGPPAAPPGSAAASSATPSAGPAGSAAPDPAAALPADLPADAVGRAHQAALGLVALGTLGAEKGTTDAVRTLGERVTTDGRAVDDRVRTLATGSGIALGDDLGGPAQALLADVGARTGETFDQGWLRAVLELTQQARDGADAVLASGAPADAKAGARDVLARLDALAAAMRGTAGAGVVATPTAVPAGSGGQAAAPGPGSPGAVAVPVSAADAAPTSAPGVVPAASAPAVGPGTVPVTVALPDHGVGARVVPAGTGPGGALVVPDPPTTVGWWSPGALAGAAAGTTLLAGHVDSAAGVGAFAVLREVAAGERVLLAGADGRELAYRVTARRELAKAALPADLFAVGGPPRLVLVTCGGRFDPATRHYADNVIVYAEPA